MSANSPPASHFDASARGWDSRPISQQLAAVAQRLLALAPFTAQEHVLDFGAGTGLLATAIAPHVAHVTALDTSANMLQVLREKLQAQALPNIRPLQQDIHTGLPQRHHAIVSCMALHHVPDIPALLRAFARNLHPGGRIALIDLYSEDGSFHGDNAAKGVHHLGFDPATLTRQASQAGLTRIRLAPIAHIHRGDRAYPLFLMQAQKPAG